MKRGRGGAVGELASAGALVAVYLIGGLIALFLIPAIGTATVPLGVFLGALGLWAIGLMVSPVLSRRSARRLLLGILGILAAVVVAGAAVSGGFHSPYGV